MESEEIRATSVGVWYNNDFSAQNMYLTVKHRANDNGLEFIIEHQLCENAEEDLKILYPKMVKAIMLGVRNPEITIGEILEAIKL